MLILPAVLAVILVALDQIIKWWAISVLKPVFTIPVIPGLFSFTYVENPGAAWGIFAGNQFFLLGLTSVLLLVVAVFLFSGRIKEPILRYAGSIVLAGGVGNLIDRARQGFVVDYLKFIPFNFPVFNLADICVVVGCGLILIYLFIIEPAAEKKKKQSEQV